MDEGGLAGESSPPSEDVLVQLLTWRSLRTGAVNSLLRRLDDDMSDVLPFLFRSRSVMLASDVILALLALPAEGAGPLGLLALPVEGAEPLGLLALPAEGAEPLGLLALPAEGTSDLISWFLFSSCLSSASSGVSSGGGLWRPRMVLSSVKKKDMVTAAVHAGALSTTLLSAVHAGPLSTTLLSAVHAGPLSTTLLSAVHAGPLSITLLSVVLCLVTVCCACFS